MPSLFHWIRALKGTTKYSSCQLIMRSSKQHHKYSLKLPKMSGNKDILVAGQAPRQNKCLDLWPPYLLTSFFFFFRSLKRRSPDKQVEYFSNEERKSFLLPATLIKVLHGEDKHIRLYMCALTSTLTHTHTHLNTPEEYPTQENSSGGVMNSHRNTDKAIFMPRK